MFKFETLDIWKRSIKFGTEIYEITKRFPKSEMFSLSSQLRRAATSVSLSIAEGSGRRSDVDFKRFVQMSTGSLNEVVTCLFIAKNQRYISNKEFNSIYSECEEISKMLYGFIRYLNQKS